MVFDAIIRKPHVKRTEPPPSNVGEHILEEEIQHGLIEVEARDSLLKTFWKTCDTKCLHALGPHGWDS